VDEDARQNKSTAIGARVRQAAVAAALAVLLLVSACTGDGGENASASQSPGVTASVGTLPAAAKEIMEKPPYASARWVYYIADAETGDVLLASRPDEMVFTGSTAKGFVVGAVYDALGPDKTLKTPVYSTTPVAGGVVAGDLVLGANDFMCLLAVEPGSTDCTDGLDTIYELAEKAGVDTDLLFLVDGQGQDPASTTPRQISRWMQWSRDQSWGDVFVKGQPVLGKTGSLAPYGADSPAAGEVAAKVGTSVAVDPVNGRLYSKIQSLAGYLTLDDGTVLVFGLSVSGATFPEVYDGLVELGEDVAGVAAAFQQGFSE
jgi:D-alanyl-D-alanine carboxypeptidase